MVAADSREIVNRLRERETFCDGNAHGAWTENYYAWLDKTQDYTPTECIIKRGAKLIVGQSQ